MLKWIFLSFTILLGLGVSAILGVVAYPQIIINDHFLVVASHLASRAGLQLSWQQGHVKIESLGFLDKRVHLDFGHLCVRWPTQGLDACFERARISAAGAIQKFKPQITEVGPVDMSGGHIDYVVPEPGKEEPASASKKKKPGILPSLLAHARLLPLHVDVPGWKVVSGPSSIGGSLELQTQSGPHGEGQIGLRAQAASPSDHSTLRLDLDLDNPGGFLTVEGWSLKATAQGGLPDGTAVHVQAKLDPRPAKGPLDYTYTVNADYLKKLAHADLQATGELSPDRLFTSVTGTARHFAPSFREVWVKGCEVTLERRGSETQPGNLNVNCPVETEVPVPPKGFPPMALPTHLGGRLVADLRTSAFPPSADSVVDGSVGMALSPILTPIFEGGGQVKSQVAGVIKDFPQGWKLDTDLGLHVKIASFEKLVRQLSGTAYDIWAPVRVLTGQVTMDVMGKFDANSGAAPVRLQTRLASKKQKLDLDATGQLKLLRLRPEPRAHLSLDLALSDLVLELPPLPGLPSISNHKLDPLPQFFPDSRFTKPLKKPTQMAGNQEPIFSYDVKIHTSDDSHPIRFLTPEIKAPIPLSVDIQLASGAPVSGGVKILSFPLELFKRDVELDHVTVSLEPLSKDDRLDGRIVIPYTDYTITVLLLGTTDKPQIRFLSDPPLPDTQIIAVLIFGQSLDALDPDQQQSVGNSRAALLSGALSLASLYYLSSMNIESVDYDPTTGTASLRYRLAQGTSLNVSQGVGGGQPSVGVRKRLTKHLAITTTLNNPSEQQTQRTVSTFFEWAYQY